MLQIAYECPRCHAITPTPAEFGESDHYFTTCPRCGENVAIVKSDLKIVSTNPTAGRRITQHFTLRLGEAEAASLLRASIETGINKSELVRRFIAAGLENPERNKHNV